MHNSLERINTKYTAETIEVQQETHL